MRLSNLVLIILQIYGRHLPIYLLKILIT